jgi:ubiquinol-cytochrome c reductase cytochrome c1 subunit
MKKFLIILCLALPALASAPFAAAQEEEGLDRAPVRTSPMELQSGARTFVNYCLGCHGISAMRYNEFLKLGLTEDEVKANLMFTSDKIGDTLVVSLTPKQGKQFFGAAPPDLSLIARSRGADWLYTYLRSFYRDSSRPTGWNNMVFPNVGMPNALWSLSGENKLVEKEFEHEHDAEAAQRAVRAFSSLESKGAGTAKDPARYVLKYAQLDKPGSQTAVQFDTTVADLTAFLVYVGEPHAAERKHLGYAVLFGLFLLIMFTYILKQEFWKELH